MPGTLWRVSCRRCRKASDVATGAGRCRKEGHEQICSTGRAQYGCKECGKITTLSICAIDGPPSDPRCDCGEALSPWKGKAGFEGAKPSISHGLLNDFLEQNGRSPVMEEVFEGPCPSCERLVRATKRGMWD
jgi:hypothetical protein